MAATAAAASSTSSMLRQLAKSSDIRWAAGGWAFFITENAILSENRTWLIHDVLGGDDELYHALYGTCSTAATASIVYAYYKLRKNARLEFRGRVLPPLSPGRVALAWGAASIGLIMASQALPKLQIPIEIADGSSIDPMSALNNAPAPAPGWKLQVRCPFDFTDKKQSTDEESNVIGLERISRHPGLWAFGFIAASSAPWQPTLPLAIWMMGPTAVAWMGGSHNDSRFRRGIGGALDPVYASQTSNIPFAAMISGKQGNVLNSFQKLITEELKPLNATVATVVATLWIISKGKSRKLPIRQ